MVQLSRVPYKNHFVSLSDVGSPSGHPVVVYLGLGGVRYLTALFDDLASSMNLRLICIDRFGLGRSDDVPSEKRGFLQWASVVEEVADQLGLGKFSILAHSAGTPFAMATCLRLGERVVGSVNLLAPWVGLEVDGGECSLSVLVVMRRHARLTYFTLRFVDCRLQVAPLRADGSHQDGAGGRVEDAGLDVGQGAFSVVDRT